MHSSSNKKVATVNKKGVVKALKKGNITVYAQIKGTSKKAKCIRNLVAANTFGKII